MLGYFRRRAYEYNDDEWARFVNSVQLLAHLAALALALGCIGVALYYG